MQRATLPVRLRAAIFDMDGVLLDSERHWGALGPEFLAGLVAGWGEEDQRSIHGMSIEAVFAHLVERYGLHLSREEFLARYRELAREIYGKRSQPLAGSFELLRTLHREGLLIGIATSAPREWVEIVMERFDLTSVCSSVVTSDDAGFRVKPAPEIYLLSVAKLGVPAVECLALEDTERGVRSATSAGLWCLGFRNGMNGAQSFDLAHAECGALETMDSAKILLLLRGERA